MKLWNVVYGVEVSVSVELGEHLLEEGGYTKVEDEKPASRKNSKDD